MTSRILVVDDSPTIRRVVSAILERHGYEAPVASDGRDAYDALRGGEVTADLVLLDFVMPHMNGYQFCRAMRADSNLRGIPIVLMSAKSDRIRDQFVQQTGAIDAITKPFDAHALIAIVENALARARMREQQKSASQFPELSSDEPQPPLELETRRTHVTQIVATKLAQMVASVMTESPATNRRDLGAVIKDRLANEALLEMVEAVRDLDREAEGAGPILSGDLSVIPIGAILQLLQVERQTGALYCHSGTTEVVASFRQGLIDLVQSSGAGDEFRLGRYFVEERILTPAEIDEAMAGVRATQRTSDAPSSDRPRLLGATLLALGKITENHLRLALTRQSSELLYDVLRWPHGRFDFRASPANALVESARLGLPVPSVVMEGFRRVDEWRVLERTLGNFDVVLVRDDFALRTFDTSALPSKEQAVLDAVDGKRNIREILKASHTSSFEACRVLVQLLEARVLRRQT
jgi:DNA-binding response OmpR family regulator